MVDPDEEVKRKLDAVVGTQFDPIDTKAALGDRVLKWIAGAFFAAIAVSVIVFVIETHRLPPQVPRPAAKPVVIQIVPSPQPSP